MKIETYIGRKRRLKTPHRGCDWIVEYKEKGKRHRKFFAGSDDADVFTAARRAHFEERGRLGIQMTEEQVDEYFRAKKIVGTADLEAVLLSAQDKGLVAQLPLGAAIAEFLKSKRDAGRGKWHMNALQYRLGAFKKKFRDWDGIQTRPLLGWLLRLGSPKTIHNYYGDISNFCNLAMRRRWIEKNPFAEIHPDDLPAIPRGIKGILTPAQVAVFMETVATHNPLYVPFFAVQAFAGIRREEAGKLSWSMIDRPHKAIIIPASICKTADSWRMEGLPANLWHFLKPPKDGEWRAPKDYEVNVIYAKMPFPWPQNALRHSFCTYHLSMHRDPARTALLLRHTNQSQLYKSYLAALVDKKTAADYFAVVV